MYGIKTDLTEEEASYLNKLWDRVQGNWDRLIKSTCNMIMDSVDDHTIRKDGYAHRFLTHLAAHIKYVTETSDKPFISFFENAFYVNYPDYASDVIAMAMIDIDRLKSERKFDPLISSAYEKLDAYVTTYNTMKERIA